MPFWRRAGGSSSEPTITVFYASDIHGSEKCFRKFVNAGRFYRADALILGGDITGKALVPVVCHPDGRYEATFLGRHEAVSDEAAITEVEGQIRFNGFYPFRITPDALADLEHDPARRDAHFEQVMRAELRRWVAIADERLADSGVMCLVMPGNDDGFWVADVLAESRTIQNPEAEHVELGPYQVLSYGYSNPTPWHSPRELAEAELEERIEQLTAALEPGRPAIFNLHVPPYDTGIDEAPEIRSNLSLVGGSSARMVPVGSHAVRHVIERHQPLLGLHGHIHESRGSMRLGPTVCVNPGSDYNTGILKGAIIRLRGREVAGIQFVAA